MRGVLTVVAVDGGEEVLELDGPDAVRGDDPGVEACVDAWLGIIFSALGGEGGYACSREAPAGLPCGLCGSSGSQHELHHAAARRPMTRWWFSTPEGEVLMDTDDDYE